MKIIVIFLFLIAALSIYFYNILVRKKQMRGEALSGIDVQLKRRADLIPHLVEIVKGYAAHESAVLTSVTELRGLAQATDIHQVKQREGVEKELVQNLSRLFVIAENYPDLKATKNFLELQDSLAQIENDIQMARRYYNGTVRDLNIAVQSFPLNIIANVTGFQSAEFFELESLSEKLPPGIKFGTAAA